MGPLKKKDRGRRKVENPSLLQDHIQPKQKELIMLFKGFGFGLFIVVAAVTILSTFGQTYEDFLTKHYDNPKSNVGDHY
ncbi:hypothetical protein Chor_009534 [Crotalus horridus]